MNKYIRQEILKEIGKEGQNKLKNSKIAIIGVGALGTTTAELLTRAGIGELLLIDKDKITQENLHRQLLFKEKDENAKKVDVAMRELNEINKDVKIKIISEYLTKENTQVLDNHDLILDCTDNMQTRHIINEYCEKTKKIWIHAAASGIKGNVLIVKNSENFKKIMRTGETFDSCSEIGVINTITTIISALQVTQTIKIILGEPYDEELIRINIWDLTFEKYKIKQ
ncbi:MAG: HesA/MoeB/ThiF family protein [Candidatus Woesearchaeota archaeon]